MSLLNKMLQDLDSRRAGESTRQSLPSDVRPLPTAVRSNPMPLVAGGLVLAAMVGGLVWWAPWKPVSPLPAAMPAHPAPIQTTPVAPVPQSVAPQPPAVVQENPKPQPSAAAPNAVAAAPEKAKAEGHGKPAAVASAPTTPAPEKPAPHKPDAAPAGLGRVDKTPSLQSPMARAEAEYRRAQSLLTQGNLADAEGALQQALRLTPEHAAARQALFGLLLEQQRKDEAQSLLEAGLAILPGHSNWAMNIARLQMEKKDAAGAWDTLQRSLPSAQRNGEYRAFCGTVLQRLGRPKEAIEHFHAALGINPSEGRWWLGLALVLESAGHPAEAREAYARAKATGNLPTDLASFADQKSRQ